MPNTVALSIFIDAIVLHVYGIEIVSQPEFTVPYLAFVAIRLFFEAVLLHVILLGLGLQSKLNVVLVCYTIVVIYSPIHSWLGLSSAYTQFSFLKEVKAQNLDAANSLIYLLEHAEEMGQNAKRLIPPLFGSAIAKVSTLFLLLSGVLVSECLTQIFHNDRFKSYVAVAFSALLNLFPEVIFGLSKILLVYTYMQK